MNSKKLFATAIFMILGFVMITPHFNYSTFAADSESNDGGGGGDNKDKGSDDKKPDSDNKEKSSDKDDNKQSEEKEIKDDEPNNDDESQDTKTENKDNDDNKDLINDKISNKPFDPQGQTPNDLAKSKEDNNDKPDKDLTNLKDTPKKDIPPDDPYEVCDVSDKCRGPGVKVNDKGGGSQTNCIGYYCFGENNPEFEKIVKSGKCDGINDSPKDQKNCLYNGGREFPIGDKNGWPKNTCDHMCKDKGYGKKDRDYDAKHDNDHHGNHHDNDYCKHHDCHHHEHHHDTHTSTSGHSGDVTVKIDLKYEETSSKNLDDMILFIGDDYDKNLDLSDKPDTIKVEHLDIDGGDTFAVCLANEDSQNGDCTVEEADNDHDTVNAFLTVK